MSVTQTLKRLALGLIGFLLLFPFLIALIDWLFDQWETYVVLLLAGTLCYLWRRPVSRARPSRTVSRGFLERVPYSPRFGPPEAGESEWDS